MLTLRFGDEKSMFGKASAIEMLGPLMMRGTELMDYQKLQDTLDRLRAEVQITSQPGLLTLRVTTKRQYLQELMPVLRQMIRRPRLSQEELDILKNEQLTNLQGQLTEPDALAPLAVSRAMNSYPRGDVRYVSTLEEEMEDLKKVTLADVRMIYDQMLSGGKGEFVAAGDFDSEVLRTSMESILADWNASVPYERAPNPANTKVGGKEMKIETPDKANSIYFAIQPIEMKDNDPDYPTLTIGNYILGGGALSSRLGDRVRQKEGLSYGIGSGVMGASGRCASVAHHFCHHQS